MRGAYTDWLRQRPLPVADKKPPRHPGRLAGKTDDRPRKRSFGKQREYEGLERELAALPDDIEALEREQNALEAKIADPDLYAGDPEEFARVTERLAALKEEQTALSLRWETAEQQLEELAAAMGS